MTEMRIAALQRASPRSRYRVWVGVAEAEGLPNLNWTLDGATPTVAAVRPMVAVRHGARTFTGEFEIAAATPDTPHRLTVSADGAAATVVLRGLPARLPPFGSDQPFRVLLSSCFHQHEDNHLAGPFVAALAKSSRPDLAIFLGDQVYLDLPTLRDFPEAQAELEKKFESDYVTNWFGDVKSGVAGVGYNQVLSAGPAAFVPDDHEYWNNFPHPFELANNTWTPTGRDHWTGAAVRMWEMFQSDPGLPRGFPQFLDVPPVSFCFADTRTERTADSRQLMSEAAWNEIKRWSDRVIGSRLFPVFVTGQTIFQPPASWLGRRTGDATLANHADYGELVKLVKRLLDEGRPLLCITGDVHWGRLLRLTGGMHDGMLYEVISSPVSLVQTVGLDTLKTIFRSGPWPRHSEPPTTDQNLAAFGSDFLFKTVHGQRGNHVVMLSMTQIDMTTLDIEVTFHPIRSGLPPESPRPNIRLRQQK
jgi:hypothetical protein